LFLGRGWHMLKIGDTTTLLMCGMESEELIEGDYVYVLGLGVLAVKGVAHPPGTVVAFPKIGSGMDLEEAYCYLQDQFPGFLLFDDHSGQVLPQIPRKSIKMVYSAREGLRQLRPRDELTERALELAALFADAAGIATTQVGVSGSILLNNYRPDSDIDLVIVDPDGREVAGALRELRERGVTRPVTEEFSRDLASKRRGSVMSLRAWIRHEARKVLYGVYRGVVYSAKLVPSPKIYWEPYGSARWRELGHALVRGVVTDSKRGTYTPMSIGISVEQVVEGPEAAWRAGEAVSFRSRFSEQVTEGEEFEACGRVELDLFSRRVRLFVGNTSRDYIASASIGLE
jgi:predicted nucleotidyltransferase